MSIYLSFLLFLACRAFFSRFLRSLEKRKGKKEENRHLSKMNSSHRIVLLHNFFALLTIVVSFEKKISINPAYFIVKSHVIRILFQELYIFINHLLILTSRDYLQLTTIYNFNFHVYKYYN